MLSSNSSKIKKEVLRVDSRFCGCFSILENVTVINTLELINNENSKQQQNSSQSMAITNSNNSLNLTNTIKSSIAACPG